MGAETGDVSDRALLTSLFVHGCGTASRKPEETAEESKSNAARYMCNSAVHSLATVRAKIGYIDLLSRIDSTVNQSIVPTKCQVCFPRMDEFAPEITDSNIDMHFESSDTEPPNTYRQRFKELPPPPAVIPRSAAELSLAFTIPVPRNDLKRILVNGASDVLTVHDMTYSEKREGDSTKALAQFVVSQFDSLKRIIIEFRLLDAIEDRKVYEQVSFVLQHCVWLAKLYTFKIRVECVGRSRGSGQKSMIDGVDDISARRVVVSLFQELAVEKGKSVVIEIELVAGTSGAVFGTSSK